MRRELTLLIVGALSVAGCERKPIFVLQGADLGGVQVECVAVTDMNQALVQCGNLGSTSGGCRCAQLGVPFSVPPLNCPNGCSQPDQTEVASGVIGFRDTQCNTIHATTCVPLVVPTDPDYDDSHRTQKAQIQMDELMKFLPDHPNQITGADIQNYATVVDNARANAVALDAQNQVQAACQTAHFSVLTQIMFGLDKGTLEWAQAVPELERMLNPYTNQLNGRHLKARLWGFLAKPAAVEDRVYATHVRPGLPCNMGMMVPDRGLGWGLAAVKDFNSPAGISNPPRPPGGGNVGARQTVVLADGSSALLTVEGISEPASLDLRGGLEIALSNCTAGGSCSAKLGELTLSTPPFSYQGYNVDSLSINSAAAASGTLVGTTLTFTSITGTVLIRLTDGRFDNVPIDSGVTLARWDVAARQFVMAFAFDSTLNDGTHVTINGTGFGPVDNTAPTAKISVSSPQSSVAGSTATVECQAPGGTTVTLSAGSSSDREDAALRFAWFNENVVPTPFVPQSIETEFVLPNVRLGSQKPLLMAYDSRGFASNDRLTVNVVDTTPPEIEATSLCVFPPNRKTFCVRLGTELEVTATDRCEGDLTSNVSIASVSSSSGTGIISSTPDGACFVAERGGSEGSRIYSLNLNVVDRSGNVGHSVVNIVVPHNGPTSSCVKPQSLPGSL